jgi:hypothetical protein
VRGQGAVGWCVCGYTRLLSCPSPRRYTQGSPNHMTAFPGPLSPALQSDATPLALVPSGPQAAELRELLQSWAEERAGAEPGTEH